MQSIGRNATIMIAGAWKPTTAVTKPSVAASEYPGAVAATPITTLERKLIAPLFSVGSSPAAGGAVAVAIHAPYARLGARSNPFGTGCNTSVLCFIQKGT